VAREPRVVRRIIGLVSGDERSFYWRLTGRQNLRYFAALYHLGRADAEGRIGDLLSLLGIAEYADRRFDSYSTGTRQKYAIARGMLTEPEILFMDEPTRALDPIAAEDLRRHITDHIVGELGRTVVLATHTLFEAERICDRIAIMRGGRLVVSGTLEELRARQGIGTVLELVVMGSAERVRQSVCAVQGVSGLTVIDESGRIQLAVRLAPGADASVVTPVLRSILDAGARIESTTTRQPDLDDIYRASHAAG
jgi:ABC-2 type transport system ATP-binding protein